MHIVFIVSWRYILYIPGVEYKYSTLDKLDHALFLASPEPDLDGGGGGGGGIDDTNSSNPNPFQTPSSVAKRTKQVSYVLSPLRVWWFHIPGYIFNFIYKKEVSWEYFPSTGVYLF